MMTKAFHPQLIIKDAHKREDNRMGLVYLRCLITSTILLISLGARAAFIRTVTGSTMDPQELSAVNQNFQNVQNELLNTVHKTSTETVHGVKTFTDSVNLSTTQGKVGIGTSSPSRELTVLGAAGVGVIAVNSTANAGVDFQKSGTLKATVGLSAGANDYITGSADGDLILRNETGSFIFGNTSTMVARVNSNGTVDLKKNASIRGAITPTDEGEVAWDSVDHFLCVSTGTTSTTWVKGDNRAVACAH